MAQLLGVLKQRFFDANGQPLAGGKLYSYEAGTTTPLNTYTDESESVANSNPIILDSSGEASVWVGSRVYKFSLYDSNDNLIWTVDDVSSSRDLERISANSSGVFSDSTGNEVLVTNQTFEVTVTGRPVLVVVQSDALGGNASFTVSKSGESVAGIILIERGATEIYRSVLGLSVADSGSTNIGITIPPSIFMIDRPPAGDYTYRLKVASPGSGSFGANNLNLVVLEL